jgi:hypothetical protein
VTAALSLAWSVVRGVLGGVPLWVCPIVMLGLFAGLQSLRYEHARSATATIAADYAEYRARVAQATAAANARAVLEAQSIQLWQDAAVAAKLARLQRENDALNQRLQEIADAPADQDGPVAAVLRQSIERLWR